MLIAEFRQFERYRNVVSSPQADAADIFTTVNEAVLHAHHVGYCLNAHINGNPLPPPPVLGYLSKHVDPLPPQVASRPWHGLLPPDFRRRHAHGARRREGPAAGVARTAAGTARAREAGMTSGAMIS